MGSRHSYFNPVQAAPSGSRRPASDPPSCAACKFSEMHAQQDDEGNDSVLLACKRYPASHLGGMSFETGELVFLTREGTDWCGEFVRGD